MASLVFRLQNAYGLLRGDQTGLFWLMIQNKTGKWIPHNQADIHRGAGIFPGKAARTIQGYDVLGVFYDDIFGPGKRDHFVDISDFDLFFDRYQSFCFLDWYHFAMIGIRKS